MQTKTKEAVKVIINWIAVLSLLLVVFSVIANVFNAKVIDTILNCAGWAFFILLCGIVALWTSNVN